MDTFINSMFEHDRVTDLNTTHWVGFPFKVHEDLRSPPDAVIIKISRGRTGIPSPLLQTIHYLGQYEWQKN
jgi:hypothetical protein